MMLEKQAYGAGKPGLNLDNLRTLVVALPPLSEQAVIVSELERRLSVIDEIEAQVAANLKRAARLRQGILKRAFEGRLVPQDPTDEPAEQLLARIRTQRASPSTSRFAEKQHRGRSRKSSKSNRLFLTEHGLADSEGDAG
jgi:type I restriction enzyme S subunit